MINENAHNIILSCKSPTKIDVSSQKQRLIPPKFYVHLQRLQIICQYCKNNLNMEILTNRVKQYTTHLNYIAKHFSDFSLDIPNPQIYTEDFLSRIKLTWQQINSNCKKDYQNKQLTNIQEFITKRASYIMGNQKRILNSLLN